MNAQNKCFRMSQTARTAAETAVLVTGSARSGTTIIGTLIHTFKNVEYVFEPPALIALFPLIEEMPDHQWKYLYEAYLYEEFLINAVSGRAINTNVDDDSSIYKVKSGHDIAERLSQSWRKADADKIASARRVAYKIPNIVPFMGKFLSYLPQTTVVLVKRGALETIHSLLAKHVFTPNHRSSDLPWPTRVDKGIDFPYWLKLGDEMLWTNLNEIDRCAYYYLRMNDGVDALKGHLVLKYAALVRDPAGTAEAIADRLGVTFGEKTPETIALIKPTRQPLDTDLLDSISGEFKRAVLEVSAQSE